MVARDDAEAVGREVLRPVDVRGAEGAGAVREEHERPPGARQLGRVRPRIADRRARPLRVELRNREAVPVPTLRYVLGLALALGLGLGLGLG